MEDTSKIRKIAIDLIEQSGGGATAQEGAELLKLASEIDKEKAEAAKLAAEEKKLGSELNDSQKDKKHQRIKDYIALLAPLFTTVVLAGTLIQQSYQFIHSEKTKRAEFVQSEKDKDAEIRRQAEAAEDLRWADSIKLLSQSDKLSPGAVILKSFAKSERYAALASQTAMQILVKTDDQVVFADLFNTVFEPVSWKNLEQIVELSRTLSSEADPLFKKSWNPKTLSNDYSRLTAAEKQKIIYLNADMSLISMKIAPLLKGQRPPNTTLDLRSVTLYNDFSGADFRGADITGSSMAGINVKDADFSGVVGYGDVPFQATAWWQASKIDRDMLQYLISTFPYNSIAHYPSPTNPADYQVGIRHLQELLKN